MSAAGSYDNYVVVESAADQNGESSDPTAPLSPTASLKSGTHPKVRSFEKTFSLKMTEIVPSRGSRPSNAGRLSAPILRPSSPSSSHSANTKGKLKPTATASIDSRPTRSEPRLGSVMSVIDQYLRMQDEVTMLRVETQQKRTALARSRDEVHKRDVNILNAMRDAQTPGKSLDPDLLQSLVSEAETARDVLGPVEQEFADSDFRLVNLEAGLMTKGREIQRLRRNLSSTELDQLPMSASFMLSDLPPAVEPNGSDVASSTASVFSFQSSSAAECDQDRLSQKWISTPEDTPKDERPNPDFDTFPSEQSQIGASSHPSGANFRREYRGDPFSSGRLGEESIDQIAPDLLLGRQWPRPMAMDGKPELYVNEKSPKNLSDHEGMSANSEEHMEPALAEYLPEHLPEPLSTLRRLLHIFFKIPGRHFKRWVIHRLRVSVLDMVKSKSFDERDVEQGLNWMGETVDVHGNRFFNPDITEVPSRSENTSRIGIPPVSSGLVGRRV